MLNAASADRNLNLLSEKRKQYGVVAILAVTVTLFTVLVALANGNVEIPLGEVFDSLFVCPFSGACSVEAINQKIVWEIRLPRILMALITGAGLSVTGAILQSVTRNPLADPYLFGISSGASLGAVVVISFFAGGAVSITFGALVGGAFSVVLMLALAGRSAVQVERLLLSGVAVSFMLGAFTSLILYYSAPETAATLLFWMMGSFSNSQWQSLPLPALVLLAGVFLFFAYRRYLSAIQAGDESAQTLGIPVNQLRLMMLLVCSTITAVLVAHVGGIGFVGLMVPHICRYLVGAQIHKIVFMCLVLGGCFMVWVDLLARSLLQNQVLPIGIVTSAVGSLFFFAILRKRSRQY